MAATFSAQKSLMGTSLQSTQSRARQSVDNRVMASKGGKKTDISKQGISSVANEVVKNNLAGVSKFMEKKGWVDAQGRKGKGLGVYRFAKKYGANVDGYSPIYTPDSWAEGGDEYKLGAKGLLAWAGLVATLLAVGATLIFSTSQLGA